MPGSKVGAGRELSEGVCRRVRRPALSPARSPSAVRRMSEPQREGQAAKLAAWIHSGEGWRGLN